MTSDGSNMGSIDSSGDPTRKYGTPDPNNKVHWTCLFCTRVFKGGSYRMKQHLVGGFQSCMKCPNPEHVRVEMESYMLKKVQSKQSSQMMPQSQHLPIDENEDEKDMETLGSSSKPKSVPPMKKMKGPLDVMFGSNPRPRLGSKNERKTIFDACDKACRDIALDKYGPGLVPPSMHELRVPLLKNKVDDVNLLMLDYKKEWAIKEDIGKLPRIKNALKKCIFMNGYIYNHMNEDNSNEVEDLVFEDDDLTWNVVSRATRANEPAYSTRGASKPTKTIASSSRVDKGKDLQTPVPVDIASMSVAGGDAGRTKM
ncbi:hypothetical protein C2S53_016759 [Perilla frutescens var. hirtella]|uniref:BED-type domain-containing protein n=1 Tax=Perilla frutescens var. hirtella TaxID=608512 RepID=A0AAD4J473_PERFH|nr:hypothetical protein C2S53_016759 [Perilla frutescens var. hirtella]